MDKIKHWNINDIPGLFDYIESIWELVPPERDNDFIILRTGGWSHNEEIIDALKENKLVWSLCWVMSTSGGYHKFKIVEM